MAANITLRQIRYFVAAAKAGRFSMAAENENVSQSAITNAVLSLEEELGVRLFDRLPQGVALTAEGKDFCHHAHRILDAVRDAMHKPRFHANNLSGSVKIAACYTMLGYFLPLLAQFRASFPNTEIALEDMSQPSIEAAVLEGRVDLGIAILSNVKNLKRFGHAVLIRSRRQLWVAPSHPLAQVASPSMKDIAAHPYIQLTVDEGETSTRTDWKNKRLQPKIAFRTGSIEALRGLVAHGFGVCILSDMMFRPWSLEGKRIETRPVLDKISQMNAGMLWKRNGSLTKPAEAFQQFLLHAHGS